MEVSAEKPMETSPNHPLPNDPSTPNLLTGDKQPGVCPLFAQAVVCQATHVMTAVCHGGLLDDECAFELGDPVGRHYRSQLSVLLDEPPVAGQRVSVATQGRAIKSPRRPSTCIFLSAILGPFFDCGVSRNSNNPVKKESNRTERFNVRHLVRKEIETETEIPPFRFVKPY
ncbi:hypothetical protein CEXT_300091 [Caerostris extrusa]|uniref:Uncharacterized protein n=1 Tax=Caerostris extrusa TaxID=172846 RepID=A0AAV4NU95_CAEEX|nr:hypothetical protein CEXT_300091 [Caerostris extrusa]